MERQQRAIASRASGSDCGITPATLVGQEQQWGKTLLVSQASSSFWHRSHSGTAVAPLVSADIQRAQRGKQVSFTSSLYPSLYPCERRPLLLAFPFPLYSKSNISSL